MDFLLDSVLQCIHRCCNCIRSYHAFQLYRRGEASFEYFVGIFKLTWSNVLGDAEDTGSLQTLLGYIGDKIAYFRQASVSLRLWYYQFKPITPVQHAELLVNLAEECFEYQITNYVTVVSILQTLNYTGVTILSTFLLDGGDFTEIDQGVVLLNRLLGKRKYNWSAYFFRAANERRATFNRRRIEQYLRPYFWRSMRLHLRNFFGDQAVFYCEAKYHEFYWMGTAFTHRDVRLVTDITYSNLLHYVTTLRIPNVTREIVIQEVRGILNNDPNYAEATRFFRIWNKMFEAIPDPFVSSTEMRNFVSTFIEEPERINRICQAHEAMFGAAFPLHTSPRALQQLCRCRIRQILYDKWMYPEDVHKLDIPEIPKNILLLNYWKLI